MTQKKKEQTRSEANPDDTHRLVKEHKTPFLYSPMSKSFQQTLAQKILAPVVSLILTPHCTQILT
jgi:hypothetical protein